MKNKNGKSRDLINKVRAAINSGINSEEEYWLEELINKEPRYVVGVPCMKAKRNKTFTGYRGIGSKVGKEHRAAVAKAAKQRQMQTLTPDVARLIWFMQPGLWYTTRDLKAMSPHTDARYAQMLAKKQGLIEAIIDPEYKDVKVTGYGTTHRGGLIVTRHLYRLTERGQAVRDECLVKGANAGWSWTGEDGIK